MSDYFNGPERLATFEKTGTPIRMGEISQLQVPDYQVLRNLILAKKWDEATQYLTTFHAQNTGMNSIFFHWCKIIPAYYAELTSV